MWYSLLLLGYKPVHHVTVLNTVGNCNTVVCTKNYNLMEPPFYMRFVVSRNVVMRYVTVYTEKKLVLHFKDKWVKVI